MKFKSFLMAPFALTLILGACTQEKGADVKVTDVDHSWVKRQSIGNCWLYAAASWAESLHKSTTFEEVNLSETYWTYWHWYGQIVNKGITTIATGGNWWVSRNIILKYGYLLEGEFIPNEDTEEMSAVQHNAEAYINAALGVGGELQSLTSRTPENVQKVLDKAYGVNMAEARARAHEASSFVVGKTGAGADISLAEAVAASGENAWTTVNYPVVYGNPSEAVIKTRKDLMKRALRAINDRQPVVVSMYIDFNALDIADATFKRSTLLASGSMGKQGGHMVVLEDYAVDNVPDGNGGFFSIEEGDVSDDLKKMALEGDVRYLVAKNSWGTDRPDRGLTDGYTRFDAEYMNLPFARESGGSASALSLFVLPPGY
ncbi:MAG: hypothetical protein AB7T49_15265 [Oligoflexales bacterium]